MNKNKIKEMAEKLLGPKPYHVTNTDNPIDFPRPVDERPTLDETYMRMAESWSQRSHAVRKKVGALVVKGDRIISDGYNGTPKGFDNVCETLNTDGTLVTNDLVLHAELNALMKLAKSTESSDGSTLYVTMSPCRDCAKMIIQAGIKKVVYREQYRITDGLDLLNQAHIDVVQLWPREE
jgi:dCMP deaminase